jgi:phosphoglycolate phosphatase-like HAD superfamily hydrolase
MVIGDRLSDVQCAKNVNAQAALVSTGYGKAEQTLTLTQYPDILILNTFDEIVNVL